MIGTGRTGLLFASAAAVAACGGGGGSSPPPSAVTVQVAAAMSAYAQAPHAYNLAGSLNGTNFGIVYTYTPGAAAMFQSQATSTATVTLTFSANGTVTSSDTYTDYFIASPYQDVGQIDLNGQWSVIANWQALPASATTPASGQLDTSTNYTDSTLTSVVLTETDTWSLSSASATSAWFCVNSQITPATGSPYSGSQCWLVDQSGSVTAFKVTVLVNGVSVTFQ